MSAARRYESDARAELQALRLRGVAGIVALVAGAWLLALPDWLPRVFGLAGCAFGVLWIVRWKRGAAPPSSTYLELRDDALVRRTGDAVEVVPWSDVRDVEVDEDRLVVRVDRAAAEPLWIEPRYGLALYALRDELRLAWRRTQEACVGADAERAAGMKVQRALE